MVDEIIEPDAHPYPAGRAAHRASLGPRHARKHPALMGLLDGKRLLITGVLTEASIAYTVAQLAQEQGAEVVLTGFGRGLRITERIAKRLPEKAPVIELDVTDEEHLARAAGAAARARRRARRRAARDRLRARGSPRRQLHDHRLGRRRDGGPRVGLLARLADPGAAADADPGLGRRRARLRRDGRLARLRLDGRRQGRPGVDRALPRPRPRPPADPGQPGRRRPAAHHRGEVDPGLRELRGRLGPRAPRSAGTSATPAPPPAPASPCSRTGSPPPPARSSTPTGECTPSAPDGYPQARLRSVRDSAIVGGCSNPTPNSPSRTASSASAKPAPPGTASPDPAAASNAVGGSAPARRSARGRRPRARADDDRSSATVLAAGPGAVVGFARAATSTAGTCRRCLPTPEAHPPAGRTRRGVRLIATPASAQTRSDLRGVIPVTTPLATALDLASDPSAATTAVIALDSALRSSRSDSSDLQRDSTLGRRIGVDAARQALRAR